MCAGSTKEGLTLRGGSLRPRVGPRSASPHQQPSITERSTVLRTIMSPTPRKPAKLGRRSDAEYHSLVERGRQVAREGQEQQTQRRRIAGPEWPHHASG